MTKLGKKRFIHQYKGVQELKTKKERKEIEKQSD